VAEGALICIVFIITTFTYTGFTPGGTKIKGTEAHGCFPEVTGPIPMVDPRWYHCVSEPESCTLKHVTHSRVNVQFVALVWWQAFPHEGRPVLVSNDILLRDIGVSHLL
jgi:hypothetical protein